MSSQWLGLKGPEIACILNNLGLLFLNQGQYQEAEGFLHRAVALWEQQSNPNPNYWAHALNNLGLVNFSQRQYEAERICAYFGCQYEAHLSLPKRYRNFALAHLSEDGSDPALG